MNVQVPFLFKYAVDYYNKLPSISTPEGTIITLGTALLLGCKYIASILVVILVMCCILQVGCPQSIGNRQLGDVPAYLCTCMYVHVLASLI